MGNPIQIRDIQMPAGKVILKKSRVVYLFIDLKVLFFTTKLIIL